MKIAYVLALCGLLAGCSGGDSGGTGGKGGTGGSGGAGGTAGSGGAGGGGSGGVGGSGGSGGTGGSAGMPSGSPDLAVAVPDMAMQADMAAAGGSGGTGGSGGGSTGPYPSGPYGVNKGDTIDGSFSWDCLKPGETSFSKVGPKDFYDPDGSRKINGLLLDASYRGCGYCEQEATDEEGEWEKNWKDNGAVAVTLLREGSDPKEWVDSFKLKHIYVCKDPNNSLQAQGYPSNVIVDPRSMKVYEVVGGYGSASDLSPLTDLAKKNKK